MHITCEQLLAKVEEKQMRCVAGFKGLSKDITGFTIVDEPNILRWLKGGEFIVSLGYVTSNNRFLLKSLIPDLVQKGCVGLGIKLGAYYDEVPEEFIELGNQYDFPIIVISQSLRFTDIAFLVYQNMFDNELRITDRMNLLYRKITRIVFSDASVESMLFNISETIGNPVILLNKDYELIAYENPEANSGDLNSIFHLKKGDPVLTKSITRSLAKNYSTSKFDYYEMDYVQENASQEITVIPIDSFDTVWGHFLIPTIATPFDKEWYQIINSIKSAVSIYMLKNYLSPSSTKNSKNNFLNMVLLSENITDYNIRYHAKLYDFDYELKRVCINLKVPDYENYSYAKRNSIKQTVDSIIRRISTMYHLKHYSVYLNENFCFYLFFPNEKSDTYLNALVREACLDIQDQCEHNQINYLIGTSDYSQAIADIPLSFKQSLDIINVGLKVYPDEQCYLFRSLKVYYLLYTSLDKVAMERLASSLTPLLTYDQENHTKYLGSLEQYIKDKYNLTKAAKSLHLHRNTLVYRLEKIREILDLPLIDEEEFFSLQLALNALKLCY
jgi:purine catabolism regulator